MDVPLPLTAAGCAGRFHFLPPQRMQPSLARRGTARAARAPAIAVSASSAAVEPKKVLMLGERQEGGVVQQPAWAALHIGVYLRRGRRPAVDGDCHSAGRDAGVASVARRYRSDARPEAWPPPQTHVHTRTHSGGTRFIGTYLARQLIEAGHEVTLLTRGKRPVDARIPDDTDEGYERFKTKVRGTMHGVACAWGVGWRLAGREVLLARLLWRGCGGQRAQCIPPPFRR